jgi:hypothetical protein
VDRDYFVRSVVRLPRLKILRVSPWEGEKQGSQYARRAFAAWPIEPYSQDDSQYAPTGPQALNAIVASVASASKDTSKNEMCGQEEPRDDREGPRLIGLSVTGRMTTWTQLDGVINAFSEAFSRLERLHVLVTVCIPRPILSTKKDDIVATLAQRCSLLHSIVVAAPYLTCLDIELEGHGSPRKVYVELKSFVANVKLNHIENVRFCGFAFLERDVIDFVEYHRHTLKRFVLKNMFLEYGKTWSSLAESIRSLKTACCVRFEGRLWIRDDIPSAALDIRRLGFGRGYRGLKSTIEEGIEISPTDRMERYILGQSDFNLLKWAYDREGRGTCWPLNE